MTGRARKGPILFFMTRTSGFTLLEVLVALLVLTVGLLGFLGTLGPAARLAGQGRSRARAAEVMASRLDEVRVALARGAPACVVPPSGTAAHPGGLSESWRVSARSGGMDLEIVVARAGVSASDTLFTALSCP